jgi:hypothetical protein
MWRPTPERAAPRVEAKALGPRRAGFVRRPYVSEEPGRAHRRPRAARRRGPVPPPEHATARALRHRLRRSARRRVARDHQFQEGSRGRVRNPCFGGPEASAKPVGLFGTLILRATGRRFPPASATSSPIAGTVVVSPRLEGSVPSSTTTVLMWASRRAGSLRLRSAGRYGARRSKSREPSAVGRSDEFASRGPGGRMYASRRAAGCRASRGVATYPRSIAILPESPRSIHAG